MDALLMEIFKHENLEKTVEKLVNKGVNKAELRALCKENTLIRLYSAIVNNTLEFEPGHQAAIPKNDGTGDMRIVYVGETTERFLCSLINDALFKLCPELVHSSCKSYQEGIGCGSSVQEFSKAWGRHYGKYYVVKSDYHHYFDDISREKVFEMIDKIEKHLGVTNHPVCNLLRRMYSNDLMFDVENNLIEKWSGIRQGNAIGSFMADSILFELDEYMSNKYPYYVRYSDDSIILCEDPDEVKADIKRLIAPFGVTINEKKFEVVSDEYIKFLGFNVNGYNITLSKSRMKKFADDIYNATKNCKTMDSAIYKVHRTLYKGNGEHSWGTQVLGIINVQNDIETMNNYCMDAIRIRAINKHQTKRSEIGGLGVEMNHDDYTLVRGKGSRVKTARERTPKEIDKYMSIMSMREALLNGGNVYRAIALNLDVDIDYKKKKCGASFENLSTEECLDKIEELYQVYRYSLPSERSENKRKMFHAEPLDNLTTAQMCVGKEREIAQKELEDFVLGHILNGDLKWDDSWGNWFYIGKDKQMILLKEWF